MPRHITLSSEALQQGYLAGQSTLVLAELFGCSPTTVAKRLHTAGIALRPARFKPVQVPEAELRRLYQDTRLAVSRIAAHFGVSVNTIGNKRRLYGIPARPRKKR